MKVKRKSFTLVEVLMAMGAFLFACSILFGVLMTTTKQNIDTIRLKQASIVASRELARIQEAAFDVNLRSKDRAKGKDKNFPVIEYEIKSEPMYNNTMARYELTVYLPSGNQHYTVMVSKR